MKKLNFGCGDAPVEGYINVDIRPIASAEVHMAAWERGPFMPGTIERIYSRHMLEHLTRADAERTLFNWFELLVPGGDLNVIVPDLAFHARQLLKQACNHDSEPGQNLRHAMAGFYGWQDPKRGGPVEDLHRWGYTWESMEESLRQTGFVGIMRSTSGKDSLPWHLNVLAAKPR
jgi:hypothetical protein